MELRDYLKVLARRKWVVFWTTIITVVVVIIGSSQIPSSYQAVAKLRVLTATVGPANYLQYDIRYTVRLMNTYTEIATSGPVLDQVKERLGLDKKPDVAVGVVGETELLQIVATDHDPAKAQLIANTLAIILIDESAAYYEWAIAQTGVTSDAPTETMQVHPVSIFELAEKPESPASPNKLLFVLVSPVLGLVGGLGLAFVAENLDTRLHSTAQIATSVGLPVLGKIPGAGWRKRRGLLFFKHPYTDIFRQLRTQLLSAIQAEELRVVLVTSGGPGEGKSTVSANLAVSLAQAGRSVVLVDADLRRPAIHRRFRLPNERGLADVLVGEVALADAIQEDPFSGVPVITSGPPTFLAAELISSPRMAALLEDLKGRFDIVLVDTPALLAAADAAALATLADGVLLVVRCHRTRRQDLHATLEMLHHAGAHLLGVAITWAEKETSDRYYRHYRRTRRSIRALPHDQLRSMLAKPLGESSGPAPSSNGQGSAPRKDPLTEIKGIGPVLERALHECDIWTFADLAGQDPEALVRKLGPPVTLRRIHHDGWIEQARARVAGAMGPADTEGQEDT